MRSKLLCPNCGSPAWLYIKKKNFCKFDAEGRFCEACWASYYIFPEAIKEKPNIADHSDDKIAKRIKAINDINHRASKGLDAYIEKKKSKYGERI